jgi:hypothetical protein
MKRNIYIYALFCATLSVKQTPLQAGEWQAVPLIMQSYALQAVLATAAIASIALIPEDILATGEGWPVFQISDRDLRNLILLWGSWKSYTLYREEGKQADKLYKTLWKA